MKDFVLQAIETLPPMPDTVIKFNEHYKQNGVYMTNQEMKELLEKNEKDKQVLLDVISSPLYNMDRQSSLDRILALVGSINVKNILISDFISNHFKFDILLRDEWGNRKQNEIKCVCDVSPYGLNGELFMESLQRQLNFVSSWLLKEDKRNHTLIPPLMSLRLGLIILSQIIILNNLQDKFFAKIEERNFKDIGLVEKEFLGCDHIEFLEFILQKYESDPVLLDGIKYLKTPHKAPQTTIKNAYIFHIVDVLFDYNGIVSNENMQKVIALMQELEQRGVIFNIEIFKDSLIKEYSYLE